MYGFEGVFTKANSVRASVSRIGFQTTKSSKIKLKAKFLRDKYLTEVGDLTIAYFR